MGFFETLRRVLTGGEIGGEDWPIDRRLGAAWDVNEVGSGADDATNRPVEGTSGFDRQQWEKKLQRVLGGLPGTRGEWNDLLTEAAALGFNAEWVEARKRDEFVLLVRRAVADRCVTEAEHWTLEMARDLIGLTESDAEAVLRAIVAEANAFYGKAVVEE